MRAFLIVLFAVTLFGSSAFAEHTGTPLDLGRPRPPVQNLATFYGKIEFRDENGRDWPYLVNQSKSYRMRTHSHAVRDQLAGVREGTNCVVEGTTEQNDILVTKIELKPTIPAPLNRPDGPSVKTASGAVFVRDNTRPELKIAWRDPNGLIWANQDASRVLPYSHFRYFAERDCRELGARLPTAAEFESLREFMKVETGNGYQLQVLPPIRAERLWTGTPGKCFDLLFNFTVIDCADSGKSGWICVANAKNPKTD